MTAARLALALITVAVAAVPAAAQDSLRVFLRAGPKTHGPGEHDHPRFLEDWTPTQSYTVYGCSS